ncbi:CLUMA_CG002489, isoform A [Clunio marinus]|uniref:CLUMA_CG002489, isoform A n=1 Tax=Clunio marinus TaxID=568069 RepID=A0A1J1HNB9_9DIPT|nr:CLUMA_CG002489, isoform A [Clunio marinus]
MAKHWTDLIWDYLVFIIVVVLASVVPLWSRFFGNKKTRTKADYVFATGSVSIISMMLSVARGTLGVRSIIGFPSEFYYRGSGMWETVYGMVAAYPIVCFLFIPVYFNLGITSVYQYIELRFKSRFVRRLASATYALRSILNLGVTVFTPTVALYTIMGIPVWMSLVAITSISIGFNLLGGLKAAITADVIQVLVTIAVSAAIIIQTMIESGGAGNVIKKNLDGGRLDFFNFTGDLTVRVDTTSALIGQLFMSMSLFGCQQNFVQRYMSMKSFKQVSKMMMLNIPVITVLFSLSWVVGMGIYAAYSECDPLKFGYTKSADAILPFFVEDKYSFVPGLMGIFLSTLFNGALILNISNLNSLATVTWEDFLSNLPYFRNMDDKKQLRIIKLIGSIYGLMIMGVGFLVQLLSGVIESAQLMTSATSGPLLGVFLLAICVPFANWKGAATGMIISHVTVMYLTFAHLTIDTTSAEFLETSIAGCTNSSFSSSIIRPGKTMFLELVQPLETSNMFETQNLIESTLAPPTENGFPQNLYAVSYMYYSFLGTALTVILGSIISLLTFSKADTFDSKYVHPVVYKISKFFKVSERLFSDEHKESTVKNSELREPVEQHFNKAFDVKSENNIEAFDEDEVNNSAKFKKNLVYKSDLRPKDTYKSPVENYKKLDEDSILP